MIRASATTAATAGLALLLQVEGAAAQGANPFSAFKLDRSAPIEIAADALEVEDAASRATFAGSVVAGQGELRLTSDRLVVWYDLQGAEAPSGESIERLRAEGEVFLNSGGETASGDWAEYDVGVGVVTMGGGVTLTQGENAITGDTLTIDLAAGTGRVEGGRVRSVFTPSRGR